MKITVEIEVSDESLRASNFLYAPDQPERLMEEDEVVMFVLQPALEARLHALRSRMKWRELKIWEHPNFPTEQGSHRVKVTDAQGNEHSVMLPDGNQWPRRVDDPREGTWKCERSPTQLCWYDAHRDRAWDFCLFCGHPHERK